MVRTMAHVHRGHLRVSHVSCLWFSLFDYNMDANIWQSTTTVMLVRILTHQNGCICRRLVADKGRLARTSATLYEVDRKLTYIALVGMDMVKWWWKRC